MSPDFRNHWTVVLFIKLTHSTEPASLLAEVKAPTHSRHVWKGVEMGVPGSGVGGTQSVLVSATLSDGGRQSCTAFLCISSPSYLPTWLAIRPSCLPVSFTFFPFPLSRNNIPDWWRGMNSGSSVASILGIQHQVSILPKFSAICCPSCLICKTGLDKLSTQFIFPKIWRTGVHMSIN